MQALSPPPVVKWFKIYAAVLMCLYGIFLVGGLGVLVGGIVNSSDPEHVLMIIGGLIAAVLGLVFAIFTGLPLLLRPSPKVWIYNLVVIALGLTSACFIPFCIALLVYWIKPETKQFYGQK